MLENGKLDALCAEIKEEHRMREDFLRAELRLLLQIKAIYRRSGEGCDHYDCDSQELSVATLATMPLEEAKAVIHSYRVKRETELRKLAKRLPVWPWVESVRGFGPLGLSQIVGEIGNLCRYPNWRQVWKRLGLAPGDTEYSRNARAISYNIGESLIKKQGEFREFYLARKAYEEANSEAGKHAAIVDEAEMGKFKLSPENKARVAKGMLPKGHIHARARRCTEKALLKALWRQWHK